MKLRRITPIQQETFYVLSGDNEDLSLIAHSPLCFSPVCYQIDEVDAGDIPAHAKIASVNPDTKKISRLTLDSALKLMDGVAEYAVNDTAVALEALRMAMLRNGLRSPAFVQLESYGEAYKLATAFEKLPTLPPDFSITKNMKPGRGGEFWIMGVPFRWPSDDSGIYLN